jgi:protein-S-isoprenylcysteine O-methyltransferase
MGVGKWYAIFVWFGFFAFFHLSEYALAVWFHGYCAVTWRNSLISFPYLIAITLGLLEYSLELVYWDGSKDSVVPVALGAAMMFIAEIIRKTAILTSKVSFTHNIATQPTPQHKLITTGIYSIFRHPSYLGWLLWVSGGQILLANPISFTLHTIITYIFLNYRIGFEEYHLRRIFPVEYDSYVARVNCSGVPFAPCCITHAITKGWEEKVVDDV